MINDLFDYLSNNKRFYFIDDEKLEAESVL